MFVHNFIVRNISNFSASTAAGREADSSPCSLVTSFFRAGLHSTTCRSVAIDGLAA